LSIEKKKEIEWGLRPMVFDKQMNRWNHCHLLELFGNKMMKLVEEDYQDYSCLGKADKK